MRFRNQGDKVWLFEWHVHIRILFFRAASQSQNECESCKQVPGYWLHTNSSGALLVTERR
jgi:hypothetical protein